MLDAESHLDLVDLREAEQELGFGGAAVDHRQRAAVEQQGVVVLIHFQHGRGEGLLAPFRVDAEGGALVDHRLHQHADLPRIADHEPFVGIQVAGERGLLGFRWFVFGHGLWSG